MSVGAEHFCFKPVEAAVDVREADSDDIFHSHKTIFNLAHILFENRYVFTDCIQLLCHDGNVGTERFNESAYFSDRI